MRASFLSPGVYDLGGQAVTVGTDAPRLEDGTIAGSVLTMDTALKNVLQHAQMPLHDVVRLLSLNPAKRIGVDDTMGSLTPGKAANLVLLSDDLDVKAVYVQGTCLYTGGRP